jgi:hypothetical protein
MDLYRTVSKKLVLNSKPLSVDGLSEVFSFSSSQRKTKRYLSRLTLRLCGEEIRWHRFYRWKTAPLSALETIWV